MKNKVSLNLNVSLLEILLSVLIFAVAGIIMLNCFAIARFTQIRANDKAIAGTILQSDLEIIKSLNSVDKVREFLDNTYESKTIGDSNCIYEKYYDENWNKGTAKEYGVTIILNGEKTASGSLISISISAEKVKPYPFIKKEGAEKIYSIETKKFFPAFGGYYE